MTSKHETGTNLENESTYQEQPLPASSEAAYDRLTGYGFARRYVEGKIVADIGWEEIGYGSRLLAGTAESVAGLASSPEAVERASVAHSAPNVSYQRASLTELPYPEGYFDVVVAFGVVENLEQPEDLVGEIKRVLKKDGVLVISVPDKRTYTNDHGGADGRRKMYVLEFQELLERHFGHVHIYRQGVVAGGFVFPASGEVSVAPVESTRLSSISPDPGAVPPAHRSIVAVCGDEAFGQEEERPYLLLDRDRRVFDECEERAEDVELMRGEIQRMQETEVQAFLEALKLRRSLTFMLARFRIFLRSDYKPYLRHRIYAIRTESRMYRRLTRPYRWLRARNKGSG